MTECGISACNNEAMCKVAHAHPDPEMRWEVVMCKGHAEEAHGKRSGGELIFTPVESEGEP